MSYVFQAQNYEFPLWEFMPGFRESVLSASKRSQQWVTWKGDKLPERRTNHQSAETVLDFSTPLPNMDDLSFRDPKTFVAGTLHENLDQWKLILADNETGNMVQDWIEKGVDVPEFFVKGEDGVAIGPPQRVFKNSRSCREYVEFICASLEERVRTGAVSVWGEVGKVEPPFLVSPLTIEPIKPRLCQNLIFLNRFCVDTPFTLDSLGDVPRMVDRGGYLTKLDDKSGYDHILLTHRSKVYMGFQWGGVWFINNTLPFGWKNAAFVYHTTNKQVTSYLRTWMVPNLLYIDDRLVEKFRGKKIQVLTGFQRSELAAYATCEILIRVGYCIGLSKSILVPARIIVFLGVLVETMKRAFLLTEKRRGKFAALRDSILAEEVVDVVMIQRLMGQCISLMQVVPAAKLYTCSMARAVSNAVKSGCCLVRLNTELREEISAWKFLDEWTGYMPWFQEFHAMVEIITDSSSYAWGCVLTLGEHIWEQRDYWNESEMEWNIAVKEARALVNGLASFGNEIENCRVDAFVDNQVFIAAWQRQAARNIQMEAALKDLSKMLWRHNICLKLTYVPSQENVADPVSRRLLMSDCRLTTDAWAKVDDRFGGDLGHTLDLMALDSNAMLGRNGLPLRHFTPFPSPHSAGINMFAQDIGRDENCYVFPPFRMLPAVVAFVREERLTCTLVVPVFDQVPNWQPVLQEMSWDCFLLGSRGDKNVVEYPTKQGYSGDKMGLRWPLMVYRVFF